MITPELIRALNARHPDPVTAAAKLEWAFGQQGLTDPLVVAHLLSQLAHESGLVPKEENLHYRAERLMQVWPARFPTLAAAQACAGNPEGLANTVYGGRMGNTQPEDGWRFRGRGLIQLTGRSNYETYGRLVGFDLVANPDLLLQYGVGALVAGAYWNARGLSRHALRDDVTRVTEGINGGRNGLEDRRRLLAVAKRHLGLR